MENATQENKRTLYPCDKTLRQKLLELREQPGWSNNTIAKKIGVNAAVVSQYLNDSGCVYPGDVPKLERSINDLLEHEARRRASGVDTTESKFTIEMEDAFEYIRKTGSVGDVLAESGDGKSRGIEYYLKTHPTALHYRTFVWSSDLNSVQTTMFDLVGKKDYDGKTKRVLNTIKNLRGSERLIIVDDAHKLTRPALQWWFDFHDATLCPIAFVGTFALLDKLQDDPQRFSRVGLHFEIVNEATGIDRDLIKHLIKAIIPETHGETGELADLCEQVAREQGHYRSVHHQLKVAVETKSGKPKLTLVDCFRAAHTMLHRNWQLN